MGQAMGGEEDLFFENGVVQAYVERPWFLMGNGNAYAVYVNGTSMEPAYRHGELCYVDPSRPPRPGQDVVVQLKDGTGFVKTLQRRTAQAVEVLQYNPEKRLRFKADEVESVHLIVAALKVPS
jgi:phage repressor protein C with HTH and peptisase S24 domain